MEKLRQSSKKRFINVELYKNDDINYYDCLLNEAYSSASSFYPNTDLVRRLRKLFAGI